MGRLRVTGNNSTYALGRNFNSNMGRLRVARFYDNMDPATVFQFQYGAIKS